MRKSKKQKEEEMKEQYTNDFLRSCGLRPEHKSDNYQYKYHEKIFETKNLNKFNNDEGLFFHFKNEEKLKTLKDQLYQEYWRIIHENGTTRQINILQLTADGYSQQEIKHILNIGQQSTITKSINGNISYKNGKTKHGGSKIKMRKIADKDEKIQNLIKEINKLELYE